MLRKYNRSLFLIFLSICLKAQPYTMAIDNESVAYGPHMEFVQPLFGVQRLADLNNDGLDDLLIMGRKNYYSNSPEDHISFYVYLRDSAGHFKEPLRVIEDFERLYQPGSDEEPIMKIGDIDGDGDLDVLTYSPRQAHEVKSFLAFYVNDGAGHLSLDTSQVFTNVMLADMGDVDNDGVSDVIIMDKTYHVLLYRNNGSAQFTLDTINTFNRMRGPLSFQDLNGDGLEDIYHLGIWLENGPLRDTNIIYLSQPNGSFITSSINNLKPNFSYYSIPGYKFMNLDTDNDLDYLMIYNELFTGLIVEYYENNGFGYFSKKPGSIVIPYFVINGLRPESNGFSIQAADFVGDAKQDLLITANPVRLSDTTKPKLFENKGWGNLSEVSETPFSSYKEFKTAMGDVNGDGRQDIVHVASFDSPIYPRSRYSQDYFEIDLYLGDSNGGLNKTGYPFQNICKAKMESIDIDMDGDLDLVASGEYSDILDSMRVFLNNGLGAFSPSPDTLLHLKADNLSYAIGDLDNDGDPDILRVSENNQGNFKTEWLQNDGAGGFSYFQGNFPTFFSKTALLLEDLDGNGHLDLLVNGILGFNGENYHLFLNSGSMTFYQDTTWYMPTPDFMRSVDMDNDGDKDILFSRTSALFELVNNGSGRFDSIIGVQPIHYNSYSTYADFILEDMNGDSLIDILYLGHPADGGTVTYRNNGNNNFTIVPDSINEFARASGTFIDIDQDGVKELIVSGVNFEFHDYQPYSEIYEVDTNFHFTLVSDSILYTVAYGAYVSGDFDSDGDEDLIYSGINPEFSRSFYYYRNTLFSGLSVPTFASPSKDKELIAIYPNPNQGTLTVQLPLQKLGDIRIYNLQGQLKYQKQAVNYMHEEFDFPNGIYIVQVDLDGKIESFKLWFLH